MNLFSLLRGWFKGNDTTTLCRYLEWKFGEIRSSGDVKESDRDYVECIYAALRATNVALSTMFSAGLWLSGAEQNSLIQSLSVLLDCFQKAANHAFTKHWTRFKLQPKFHSVCEVKFQLMFERRAGAQSLNPVAFATQQDEDFVGRLCNFSKVVSSRTLSAKVIERYQIALRALW